MVPVGDRPARLQRRNRGDGQRDGARRLDAPAIDTLHRHTALIRAFGVEPDRDALLFSTAGRTPFSGITRPRRRLDEILARRFPGVIRDRFTLHDSRTAFATAMGEAGHPEGVIDRILNHAASSSAASSVARVYDRANLPEQRAQVLDARAAPVTGERGEAVSFPGAALGE